MNKRTEIFRACIDQMVQGIKVTDDVLDMLKETVPDRAQYFRELRTIQMSMGRQSGRQTWIIEQVAPDVLIISHNAAARNQLKSMWLNDNTHGDVEKTNIVTRADLTTVLYGVFRVDWVPPKYKMIIVNDASYVFDDTHRNRFYKEMLPLCDDDTIFVLLG